MKFAALILILALAAGCGGKGSPTGPTSPEPKQQPQTQVVTGTVGVGLANYQPLTIYNARSVSITLQPSNPSADLDLYLTTTCTALRDCTFLSMSNRAGGGGEQIQRSVAPGDFFTIWVDNYSSAPQNYTLTVTLIP